MVEIRVLLWKKGSLSSLLFSYSFNKHHICMDNIQVDQYHEEAGGQRTVVRLGNKFSLSLGNSKLLFASEIFPSV